MRRWIWQQLQYWGPVGTVGALAVVVMISVGICTLAIQVPVIGDWWDDRLDEMAEDFERSIDATATARAGEESTAPRVLVGNEINLDELSEEDRESLLRWREAGVHWEFVDAFSETMHAVNADKVIDLRESRDLCYKAPQWREQMTAAREYVAAYREAEPETVADNPRISNLEVEADRAMEIVEELERQCR